jgi:CRP/FNR family cyclic AMP-dependent transcriptional regulator
LACRRRSARLPGMRTSADLLRAEPSLRALTPTHRETIAGCARNRVAAPGEEVMREGEPADAFYIVRDGAVAIVTHVPGRGELTLETLHAGDLLGWSWLVPPYRNAFGARAAGATRLLALDAACLRRKCDEDPGLGYDLLKLLAGVFTGRLRDARLRLLDLYGADGHDR